MEGATESLGELFEAAVKDETKEPELDICLEIADRMNASKNECKEGVKELTKVLRSSKAACIHNAVLLLESLVKNCSMRFHYEISSKEFMDALLRLLKRKRKKTGFFDTMYKNSAMWDEIENKVLGLIQLWADTFMMHEDEFHEIMECYRLLRKEGIKFPPRDKNEKFMIQFKGTTSPIFEYLENMPDVIKNQQPESSYSKKTREMSKSGGAIGSKSYTKHLDIEEREREEREKKRRAQKKKKKDDESDNEEEDEGDDDREYTINEQEVEMIMGALTVLEEIRENAEKYSDLKTEVAMEIISDCKMCYKRLNKMTKGNRMNNRNLAKALELQDSILEGLGLYKSKAEYLKNIGFYEKEKRLSTEPEQPKQKSSKKGDVRSKSPKERTQETKEEQRKKIIDLLNDEDDLFGGKPANKSGVTPGEGDSKKEEEAKTLHDIFSKDFYMNMMATKATEKEKSPFAAFEGEQKPPQVAAGFGSWSSTNPFAPQSVQPGQIQLGMPQPGYFGGQPVPVQVPYGYYNPNGLPQAYGLGYPPQQMVAGYPPFVGAPVQMGFGFPQVTPGVTLQGVPTSVTTTSESKRDEVNGGTKDGNDDFFADLANRNVKSTTEH
eukprot:TRINITY_DN1243_c0_g1_i3.p1 TRINITY_DN1243_c0_g1~~TRINITY_DN1243_c0_g1_i3.p1  ORF type:complete len:608 (-),score=191.45 TRINITY_DN1243_c0_g1_i3:175-1998(-)